MSKMLIGSIDLSKLKQEDVISTDKNGNLFLSGAEYLNIVVWINDQPDQYGNIAKIHISQPKEEREQGIKPRYIGNLKHIKS